MRVRVNTLIVLKKLSNDSCHPCACLCLFFNSYTFIKQPTGSKYKGALTATQTRCMFNLLQVTVQLN